MLVQQEEKKLSTDPVPILDVSVPSPACSQARSTEWLRSQLHVIFVYVHFPVSESFATDRPNNLLVFVMWLSLISSRESGNIVEGLCPS